MRILKRKAIIESTKGSNLQTVGGYIFHARGYIFQNMTFWVSK